MHELSVCQALLRQVQAIAMRERATTVQRVTVQIGVLSGVEPDLLARAFPAARAGTVADQAELRIETVPLRVHCQACGAHRDVTPAELRCPACGSAATRLVSGDELLLVSIDVQRTERSAPNHV